MRRISPRLLHGVAVVTLALSLLLPTLASHASDHGAAPAGAKSVAALLERVQADFGEVKVLKIELEKTQSGGTTIPVYEIKMLTPRGSVLKAVYDARTLSRVSVKGRRQDGDDD